MVEPVAGIITILLFAHIAPALPYLLAFAAGAMMYVVVEELIPESQAEPHSNIPTLGFTISEKCCNVAAFSHWGYPVLTAGRMGV